MQPLRALKDQTRDLHLLAEQYVRILDADATTRDYVRYLRAMLGFHAVVEEMFARDEALAAAGFSPALRIKSHLLLADLRALDAAFYVLPRCACVPDASSLPRALGVAYVIEGSTLGGKYILSRLPEALAPLRGTATSFLEGYGEATGARWKSFCRIVEASVCDERSEQEAVAGARDTFLGLIDWLSRFEQRDEARERRAS